MDFFKKNKIAGIIIITLVILNIILITLFWLREFHRPAFSFRDMPRKDRPERIRGFFQDELDLTEAQVENFTAQRRAYLDELKPIMKQIHDLRMELTDAIFAAQPDEARVRDLIGQISQLEQKREFAMFSHINQVRALCTPEQQIKLKDLMRDVMMHSRFEIRGERPDHRMNNGRRRP